ncbi:MAG: hypothetical protein M1832_005544 [Thelocarpon impressellum]|nr:MAG: hypothetical protein M1832_005544 [Thelocarpon impressellum]
MSGMTFLVTPPSASSKYAPLSPRAFLSTAPCKKAVKRLLSREMSDSEAKRARYDPAATTHDRTIRDLAATHQELLPQDRTRLRIVFPLDGTQDGLAKIIERDAESKTKLDKLATALEVERAEREADRDSVAEMMSAGMAAARAAMKEEIAAARAAMKEEIASARAATKEGIATARATMKEELASELASELACALASERAATRAELNDSLIAERAETEAKRAETEAKRAETEAKYAKDTRWLRGMESRNLNLYLGNLLKDFIVKAVKVCGKKSKAPRMSTPTPAAAEPHATTRLQDQARAITKKDLEEMGLDTMFQVVLSNAGRVSTS